MNSNIQTQEEAIQQFWSKALGLTLPQWTSPSSEIVSTGLYVERNPDGLIYYMQDLVTGKRVLASSEKNLKSTLSGLTKDNLGQFDFQSIRTRPEFSDWNLEYKDIDFFLDDSSDFRPLHRPELEFRWLSNEQKADLEAFYAASSEDDIDTLDLQLGEDLALGVYVDRDLAGVTRYVQPKASPSLADLTVMIQPRFRGKGLSSPLVSQMVIDTLNKGLFPRYRVEEDNHASLSVAKKLGFTARNQILVWSKENMTKSTPIKES